MKPFGTNQSKKEPYQKILNKINTLVNDRRMSFLMKEDSQVLDNLHQILSRILRMPVADKPISIINLSGIPSDVVDIVVSLLARVVFDFAVWGPRSNIAPILFLCEEAHRYVPKGEEATFEPARKSLARIAKEGRKYGVSLGLITQRPSEISESVLSQCSTLIALRMTNETDQNFVKRALPDGIKSLVDTLASLRTQEAIVVGEGVSLPVRVLLDTLESARQPHSNDVPFSEIWQNDCFDGVFVDQVISYWRNQDNAKSQENPIKAA